ncbi:MAG: tRNA (adenosine(37)-N6)-threonylcarbamoyltransferase complex dimerization subunit type 1 TsaB [Candidatus Azobacteroides sp.]|nr:tRNA (adenosine(37)-N6)-threonylcarbamoyltransferase complex dimerization subunit type 1 TsaB [Candidatus Azobacteroides sp.]
MACILLIESSAYACSAAVSVNGKSVWEKESAELSSHSTVLGPYAAEALRFIQANHLRLDAVAVSEGPGSYTGLRIGVSLAKGLCFGLDIPLIAVPTLKIMAARFVPSFSYLCPMIDARRMEVYSALYDGNLNEIEPIRAMIIDENSYRDLLCQKEIIFFGTGADKCKTVIRSSNAVFVTGIYPAASDMTEEAEKAFSGKIFADVVYFEPFYLKEFQATTPKNKIISGINKTRI